MSAAVQAEVGKTNGNGHGEHLPAVSGDGFLARALADPSMDAAKVSAMWEVQKDIILFQGKREFAEALARAQAEFPIIMRDAYNDHTKSHYARFETMWEECREIWCRHGFSVSFPTVTSPDGNIRMHMRMRHGDYVEDIPAPDAPSDIAGSKGTANKTGVQGNKSTMSYLKRGLLEAGFGIVTRGDDNDGNAAARNQRQRENAAQTGGNGRPPTREQNQPGAGTPGWLDKALDALDAAKENRDNWIKLFVLVCTKASTIVDLDAFAKVPGIVNTLKHAPPHIAKQMNDALAAGRTRLSQPAYRVPLVDADGVVMGEYTLPASFARALVELWKGAIARDATEAANILHHNADAIAEARTYPAAALVLGELDPQQEQTGPESGAVDSRESQQASSGFVHEPVMPPKNGAGESWPTWRNMMIADEIPTVPEFCVVEWVAAQKPVVLRCTDPAIRSEVALALGRLHHAATGSIPEWLTLVSLKEPSPARDPLLPADRAWVNAALDLIPRLPLTREGKQQFDNYFTADHGKDVMARAQRNDPPSYKRVVEAATIKQREFNKSLPK